jgi:hypothetical protein
LRLCGLAALLGAVSSVEIRERNDQAHVVQRDQAAQRIDVGRVVDARDEGAAVGVIQRR